MLRSLLLPLTIWALSTPLLANHPIWPGCRDCATQTGADTAGSTGQPPLPGADDPQLLQRRAELDRYRVLGDLDALLAFADQRGATSLTIRESLGDHELSRRFSRRDAWQGDERIRAHVAELQARDPDPRNTVYATVTGSFWRNGRTYGYRAVYQQVGNGWQLLYYEEWLLGNAVQ